MQNVSMSLQTKADMESREQSTQASVDENQGIHAYMTEPAIFCFFNARCTELISKLEFSVNFLQLFFFKVSIGQCEMKKKIYASQNIEQCYFHSLSDGFIFFSQLRNNCVGTMRHRETIIHLLCSEYRNQRSRYSTTSKNSGDKKEYNFMLCWFFEGISSCPGHYRYLGTTESHS